MKYFNKTLGLLLATLALASCGGSGSNGGVFAPPVNSTITLSATSTTLPVNTQGYLPSQYGNPTQATVTIDWHNPNGSLVSGQSISVSISPPNVAALSCIVDASCTDANQLFGQLVLDGTNGHATVFVNSYTTAGTATLTATGVDPTTHANVSASMVFTITSGVGPAPASVTLTPSPAGVYLPGSGGSNTSAISATVLDGAGQLVPDPVSGNNGVDNIQFSIVGNAGDATLSTSSVAGPVSGTTVTSHTVHGAATASFQAGAATPQGPVQIKATVDRADNNVSNGIQDPVSFTASVIVSDGKLYSLEITSPVFAPNLPGVTINSVSGDVSSGSSTTIPPDPDATLSLVVTALATDRQSNPVIPGTSIRFGAVDEPVGAPGSAQDNQFLLSGYDGNPQEGGTTFTAPSGQFTTAGGGAGPGDALVVFGKAVDGNSDLESAVTVQTVNSATNLTTAAAFNRNDTTGQIVDYGSVLPYLIGRAEHGNITATATTDAGGVAHASLNYTVNSVGDAVAIFAQGNGVDTVTNGARRVTDAGTLVYPGLAPATMVVTPMTIPGNATQNVTVCVTDALGISLRGVPVGFTFNLTSGSGKVDGVANAGTFASLTGVNGCATGSVTTAGVTAGSDGTGGTLDISAAGQTAQVTVTAPVIKTLTVNVTAAVAGTYTVSLGGSSGFSPPGQATSCTVTGPATAALCGTFTFNAGATATLGAAADAGQPFTGWTDGCTGTSASTSVVMSDDVICTATFGAPAP